MRVAAISKASSSCDTFSSLWPLIPEQVFALDLGSAPAEGKFKLTIHTTCLLASPLLCRKNFELHGCRIRVEMEP